MGLRYRKSINLGGGFKINLSKSGIGYSWGVKGYRVTKTAKGTIRKTYSIPGTGISYTEEKRPLPPPPPQPSINNDNNLYDTQEIVNNNIDSITSVGLEEMLLKAQNALLINRSSTIGIIAFAILGCSYPQLFIFAVLFVLLKIYIRTRGRINLEYEIEEDQKEVVIQRMAPLLQAARSEKLWRIVESSKVIDRKYASGANSSVERVKCIATQNTCFPFKSSAVAVSFKSGKETLLFLPDKLFIKKGMKMGALNYEDISTSEKTVQFVEGESVPKDTTIIDWTWKYVNKSGEPDRRFKNNRQIPVCAYGQLEFHSANGLNTVIMFSNASSSSDN